MKINKKSFTIAHIGLILSILLVGCNVEPVKSEVKEERFTTISSEWCEGVCIDELRDNTTGVHYLMVDGEGLTVMYNADGTIKID